jgi:hypothetical protein
VSAARAQNKQDPDTSLENNKHHHQLPDYNITSL